MRNFCFMILLISFVMAGCSDNNATTEPEPLEKEVNKEEDTNEEVKLVENSQGSFKRFSWKEDIGTYEIGPLTIDISDASLVSGTYTDELITSSIGREDVEYISVGTVISTSNENITFTWDHLSLTTSTGEEVSPNDSMSDQLTQDVLSEKDLFRFFKFYLDESKVKNIQYVILHIKAPKNDEGESLGEDLDVKITF
ncbi:hypothetical protein EQV77_14745 [Halobacillus fulvus]|nr:hypothetical protein EQV77_14745 [Halobacillus fulvus]